MDYLLARHFTAIFLIVLFSVRLLSERTARDTALRYFWLTVISCLLLVFEDIGESFASENPDLRFWRTLFSAAGYFLRSTAALGLALVVCGPRQRRNVWLWVPCGINLLVCFTAFFSDVCFGFNAKYEFYRGPLGFVPFVVPLLYLACILWITFRRYGDTDQRMDRLILVSCAAFCLLAALLDATRGGVRLHDAMLVSSLFFYLYLRSYDVRRDALTLLLNRQSMYDDCASLGKNITAAASLDMNGLKAMNDRFGHAAGDAGLKKIGECLLAVSGPRVRCYRIGGDEFVMLFFHMEEEEVQKTLDRLNALIKEAGGSIACGYVMREKDEAMENLIRRSDLKMFEHKAQHYREKRNDRRRRVSDTAVLLSAEARAAIESSPQPVAVYQFREHRIQSLAFSEGYSRMFGFPMQHRAPHVLEQSIYPDIHPDDRERFSGAMLRFSEGTEELDIVYRSTANLPTGYRVIHARGSHGHGDTGARIAYVWYMDEGDYTPEKDSGSAISRTMNNALHEESIFRAAHYDELTGLSNLGWFFNVCESKKTEILSSGKHAALLFMDLNGMKYFNHKYGFAEGDRLLKAFAKCIGRIFGRENCCHISADHFAVAAYAEKADEQVRQLFTALKRLNDGKNLPVMVGIYSTEIENVPVSTAYDRAKLACDAIRRTDTSAQNRYSRELSVKARKEQYVVENIGRAIEEKWIQVYYQPIVRAVGEQICDEEALARWIDPAEGFLSPADFVPQLEKSGMIYKLDLYVLDQVLEKIKGQKQAGIVTVPHSINLSRSDFDVCDIVEEIRKRVDAAGVPRDRITIEVTESVIGSNLDFMKNQIARFRAMGFSVWMDDFGSGYSSLDVLQSIPFDLIKFDMSFLRKLDKGDSGKIILTEMMKLATSLHLDTVCEGVETEAQVRFLQEIGCSKLQGYYYGKPSPLDEMKARYEKGAWIGFEDPAAAPYYEEIGRVNLYDLGVVAGLENENSIQHAFSTLPMTIMEVRGNEARFVRSTPSYREFVKRFFEPDLSSFSGEFRKFNDVFMRNLVLVCCEQGHRSFFHEKMSDGATVHSFARRIAVNPVNGCSAVAVAVLSISEPGSDE